MSLILYGSRNWKGMARVLTMSLLALALTVLVACSGDDSKEATEEPQQAATPAPSAPQATAAPTPADAAPTPTAAPTARQTPAAPTPAAMPEPGPVLQVVTTTNFVADWVRNVGGDRVEVFGLLPPGGDPHTFLPGARDVAKVADADLIFTVGLGLEADWLEDLLHNASADESKIIALGEAVDPIEFAGPDPHGHHEDDHDEHDDHDDHDDDDDHDEHEDEHHDEHGAATGRLIIADREQAALSVLDLTTEGLAELRIPVAAAGARVYSSPSGRFAFIIARGPEENDDRVHVFDGGIYLEEHGDHMDLISEAVAPLSVGTSDDRPIHVTIHAGWTAIFHDGTGRAALFEEHHLEEEYNEYEPVWMEAGLQHGAVVPLGEDLFLVTSNNPDYPATATSSLPLGAEIRTVDNEVVYDASNRSCPGMHGEAANHHGVALGCVGGVLFVEGHDDHFEHVFINNPSDMKEDARIGSLWGHDDSEHFFGSASYRQEGEFLYDGLWMIDAEGEAMTRVLPSTDEKRVYGAAFDGHGEEFFALTADGMLNVINPESGDVEEEVQLVAPFDGDTSPSFIVVGEMIYVSDRAGGRIFEFSVEHGEIEREWSIDGMPGSLAFVGIGAGSFEEHGHDEHEDEHEDDDHEEDEHGHEGHDHGPLDPHFWFDPPRVKIAVDEIAEHLAEQNPESADFFRANAAAYKAQLDELHAWTQEQVELISPERRLLLTSHDTFTYFAQLYGFQVVGLVIPSLATHVEPSPEHIADLVEAVRENNVPAIFAENTVDDRLVRAIALETGAKMSSLYTGSLGPEGSDGETYLGMVRSNVMRIVEALR